MTKITYIPGEIANAAIDEHGNRKPVTRTQHIFDDAKGKSQAEVNKDVDDKFTQVDNEIEGLEKQDVIPVDTLPAVATADPKKIYRVVGEDSYTDHMVNATGDGWKRLATYSFPGIDDKPTANSDNLVKSGGVYQITPYIGQKVNISDFFQNKSLILTKIELTQNGYYDYREEYPTFVSNTDFRCVKIDNVSFGELYSYKASIQYGALAAVIFLDENGKNIGYLYASQSSERQRIDTGIFTVLYGAYSIILERVYIAADEDVQINKYSIPQFTNVKETNEEAFSTIFTDDDYKRISLQFTNDYYVNWRNGQLTPFTGTACAIITDSQFSNNDRVAFKGYVRYGNLAAIIFLDENENVISYVSENVGSESVYVDTGLVAIPVGTKKIAFDSWGYTSEAFLCKFPKVITEENIDDYLNADNTIRYCNPYHYVMGITAFDDIISNGFDANFASSTQGAYLIHSKYFKSYRRKLEWKVLLSTSSVVSFGTTSSTSTIITESRMSKARIDTANNTLTIYKENDTVLTTVPITDFVSDEEYILRASLYDYELKFEIIRFKTLQVCASYTHISTPTTSQAGKLLGYPFIQLNSGTITIKEYNTYLMYKPDIVFVGDSITECGYRQNTYASMFIENDMDNNGCIISQGGANIAVLGFSLDSEIIFMKPKYLSLLAGTNGTITNTSIERWKSFCDENDIIFILNTVPVSKDSELYPWTEKNNTILSNGILGTRFDIATALNNNPSEGANDDLFADDVHPNAAGQQVMYERFKQDVGII